ITKANNGGVTLEQLAQNDKQQQIISQLRDTISVYQRAAQAAAEAHLKVGINEDSGLYKEMRVAARALEDAAQVKDSALRILVLQMRRNENDLLSYHDSVYFLRLVETKNAVLQAMQASGRPETEQAQFSQLVNTYFDTFGQLVQGMQWRESLIADMK